MSRMKDEFEFVTGIHFNGELFFNKYNLLIDFYAGSESLEDQNIAMERIAYFIQDVVNRAVFVDENDIDTIMRYAQAEIPVLTVPSPGPIDPLIQAVVVTKLNSMLEGVLVIFGSEIRSMVGGHVTYIWDAEDADDEVHDVVNTDDDTKWWASADPRFASYDEGTDVEEYEEVNPYPLNWKMMNLHWTDEDETNIEFIVDPDALVDNQSDVIKLSDFLKPKK